MDGSAALALYREEKERALQERRISHAQLMAEAAGKVQPISAEMARLTAMQVGSGLAGWFSFQPLFDKIVHDQPDLLD